MVKRRELEQEDSDYMLTDTEVSERPRTSRRAKHEAQKVLAEVADNMSDSEPEQPPKLHWRKRLALAQKAAAAAAKPARKPGRKPGRPPGRKPKAPVSSAPRPPLAPLPTPRQRQTPPPPPPVEAPPPQKVQLPSPLQPAAPLPQPYVVPAGPPPKLRQHHHEFLSEYRQHQLDVAAAAGTCGESATQTQLDGVSRQLSALPPLELACSQGSDAAEDEFDAIISSVLAEESPFNALPTAASVANITAPLTPDASPQSSACASCQVAPADGAGLESKVEAQEVESPGVSDATAVTCGGDVVNSALGRSGGSGMWRLPSNSALLSYASCMAA